MVILTVLSSIYYRELKMIPEDKGFLILNGNIRYEKDLIIKFSEEIKHLHNNYGKNILLITAAWADRENHHEHINDAFVKLGISDKYIHNLNIYQKMKAYLKLNPIIGSKHSKIRKLQRSMQSFYRLKNRRIVNMYRDLFEMFKVTFPNTKLSEILSYNKSIQAGEYDYLVREKTFQYLSRDIKSILRQVRFQDNIFSRVHTKLFKLFLDESSIRDDVEYKRCKQELTEMINSASSIFIFGGNVTTLLDSIIFFGLNKVFKEQLERNVGIFTISAGSVIMCPNIVIYNDFNHLFSPFKSEFEFLSKGLNVIRGVQIFPHCKDRIKMDDPDNLSYLAYRFSEHICTGLDMNSYLLVYNEDGKQKTISYGEKEGAYIFNVMGEKIITNYGQELDQGILSYKADIKK